MQFFIDEYFPDSIDAVGDAGMAGFDEKRPLYLSGSKSFLNDYRDVIKRLHQLGTSGTEITHLISDMMDVLHNKLFVSIIYDLNGSQSIMQHITLAAVGGYGRGELNPYSDIDIMFLHDGSISEAKVEDIAQKLLYFLWDMRLDVGYSVRTVADCVEMAETDPTIKTALMDARFLSGSRPLFNDLYKIIFSKILPKSSDSFIKEKVAEMKQRRQKYGSTVYLLEPNLKEGEGGLRDLQSATWIARVKYKFRDIRELIIKGIINDDELQTYYAALDYLWRIRNELHYFNGRKNDQLTFNAQVHLSIFLGYTDSENVLAVEEFMRDYYRHANKVEHFTSSIVSRCVWRDEGALKIIGYFVRREVAEGCFIIKGELTLPDESIMVKRPVLLMNVFELAHKHGVALSVSLKGVIRKYLALVDDRFRRSPEVNESFMNILRSVKGVAETLRLMHHLEFLNRFIPEFENIYCKVQHDIYHIYTVDIHTLFAVEQAEKLLSGEFAESMPLASRICTEIGKPELLILAVMFHDIGKGMGGGHAEKGAMMIPAISRRLGLSIEDSTRLEFLVRQHLLFAHISQRRDLNDEKMIAQFARQMESSENLKMLYLLTLADVRAVGSDVWTSWKAALFQELFEKSFAIIDRGGFYQERSSERALAMINKVVSMLEYDFAPDRVRSELNALPPRLLLSNPAKIVAGQVSLLLGLDKTDLLMQLSPQPEGGYAEFTICTHDQPGLFSRITGVMAANGINILGAQINTSKNGNVLDILQINLTQGEIEPGSQRWEKVEQDMRSVIHGEIMVSSLVAGRKRPTLLTSRPAPRFPTKVDFDNEVSQEYTVIDILTHDKVGLLYLITSTLTEMGLYIGVSKISTKVDQVADVFYVRDIFGHKITAADKLSEMGSRLAMAIDEWV